VPVEELGDEGKGLCGWFCRTVATESAHVIITYTNCLGKMKDRAAKEKVELKKAVS